MMPEVTNYMRLALDEAVFSIGVSRPNPAVGAVVVKDGIIVGKGRTQRPGSAHAEVMALRDAGELARGAAIYVTLEPCCHYGRTPPCTKAIIDAGISEVYYAHGDPNPVVRGNSRKILEEAGIEVYEGVDACIAAELEDAWDDACGECHCLTSASHGVAASCHCEERSDAAIEAVSAQRSKDAQFAGRAVFHDVERYFEAYDFYVRNKRTFVEVKCAVSQENFMGVVGLNGEHLPTRITGEGANCWNHELRAISDAVLVGAGTVLADNPSLNTRLVPGNDPVKIIWAGHHEFTADEVAKLKVFACHCEEPFLCHPERSAKREVEESGKTLVFSCVPQPAFSERSLLCHSERSAEREVEESSEGPCVILLTGSSFAENWTSMIDELSARGMHRLMVEPGAGLAKQLFDDSALVDAPKPIWNRLNIWRSTDCRIDDAIADLAASGNIKEGLEFPELPKNIVAKESFMTGPDVLTVYYPA